MKTLKTNRQALLDLPYVVAGLKKHFAGQTLRLGGVRVTAEDAIAALEAYMAALKAVTAARAQLVSKVTQVRNQKPSVNSLLANLHTLIRLTYGAAGPALTDFGMKQRSATKKAVATRLGAVKKSAATRTARHTMGKTQKAKIRAAAKPA